METILNSIIQTAQYLRIINIKYRHINIIMTQVPSMKLSTQMKAGPLCFQLMVSSVTPQSNRISQGNRNHRGLNILRRGVQPEHQTLIPPQLSHVFQSCHLCARERFLPDLISQLKISIFRARTKIARSKDHLRHLKKWLSLIRRTTLLLVTTFLWS